MMKYIGPMPFNSDHSLRTMQSTASCNNWLTMTTERNNYVPEIVSGNLNKNAPINQNEMQSTVAKNTTFVTPLVHSLSSNIPLQVLPYEAPPTSPTLSIPPVPPTPPTLPLKNYNNILGLTVTKDLLKTVTLMPPGDKPRTIKKPIGMQIVKKEHRNSMQPLYDKHIPTMLLPKLIMDIHEDSNDDKNDTNFSATMYETKCDITNTKETSTGEQPPIS